MRYFISCLIILVSMNVLGSKESSTLNVYYSESPPYSFPTSVQGRGVLIDYMEELFIELKIPHVFESMSWNEAINAAAKDSKGVFVAGIYSKDRQEYFKATKPVYAVTHQFYRRHNNDFFYDGTPRSLHGLRIGVIKGWSYAPEFSNAHGLMKVGFDTTTMGLVALYTGEIDLLATDHLLAEYVLTYQLPNIKYEIVSAGNISENWISVLVNREIPEKDFSIKEFNKVLMQAEAENRVEEYQNKYLKTR